MNELSNNTQQSPARPRLTWQRLSVAVTAAFVGVFGFLAGHESGKTDQSLSATTGGSQPGAQSDTQPDTQLSPQTGDDEDAYDYGYEDGYDSTDNNGYGSAPQQSQDPMTTHSS